MLDLIALLRQNQSKYLNNLVEQDHRAVKRITRPMLGFKTFRCARILLAGIEVMHMIRKGQLGNIKDRATSAANHFYSLAFWTASASRPCLGASRYCDTTRNRTALAANDKGVSRRLPANPRHSWSV